MKTPFRQQTSEYDCVPTTFLNAVSHLFERTEIPPLVIQRIYLYCLDSVSSHHNIGHGTTGIAVRLLGNWLNEYKYKKFRVSTEYCSGDFVHLRKGNKLTKCLNRDGVALLRVTLQGNYWHYILGLSVKDGWFYCYDPYKKTSRASKANQYEFIEEDGLHSANLRIKCEWLDTHSNQGQYRFGTKSERECLLLERV
jgi:hypothetical protein